MPFENILLVIFITASIGIQSCAVKNEIKQEVKPNIIFFFSDDQSYDTQKDFGNPNTITPNLDILASKGVSFKRHYNTTAICMASRANVITGQYEYKTGCNFSHGPLGKKQWSTSYPMLLKKGDIAWLCWQIWIFNC